MVGSTLLLITPNQNDYTLGLNYTFNQEGPLWSHFKKNGNLPFACFGTSALDKPVSRQNYSAANTLQLLCFLSFVEKGKQTCVITAGLPISFCAAAKSHPVSASSCS